MKTHAILTVVLAVFFSILTCSIYNSIRDMDEPLRTGDGSALRELGPRLQEVQAGLDSLAAAVAEISRQPPRSAALTASAASAPSGGRDASEADDEREAAAEPDATVEGSAGERLAALLDLEGGEEEMRDYVVGIIDGDRTARRRIESRKRVKRRELFKGPYGENNFRVNSLAAKIDLSDWQKEKYHELLDRYGKQAGSLMSTEDGKPFWSLADPRQIEAHVKNMEEQRRALGEQLDAEFVQSLDPDQAEAYLDLPERERGTGSGMGMFTSVNVDGGHVTGSATVHIGGVEGIDVGEVLGGIEIPGFPGREPEPESGAVDADGGEE